MERLTIKNSDGTYSQPTDTTFEKVFNKLAQLEDTLEKYNIGSVEELDETLDELKQELNCWRKACELACENISAVKLVTNEDMEDNIDDLPNYFYENSKKELENE